MLPWCWPKIFRVVWQGVFVDAVFVALNCLSSTAARGLSEIARDLAWPGLAWPLFRGKDPSVRGVGHWCPAAQSAPSAVLSRVSFQP